MPNMSKNVKVLRIHHSLEMKKKSRISNSKSMVLKSTMLGGMDIISLKCTDTPNFICAIKQRGLGQTIEVYNSLLAQLA